MENFDLSEIKYFEGIDTRYVIDSLTHVISREYIEMLAKKMLDEKIPFTLMILDLDNFKQINDSFGHSSGDFILKNIGEWLRDVCKKEAYVGRFGGDEFLLLIPNKTSYNDVHHFLENLYFRNSVFRRYYNDKGIDIYVKGKKVWITSNISVRWNNFDELILFFEEKNIPMEHNCNIKWW